MKTGNMSHAETRRSMSTTNVTCKVKPSFSSFLCPFFSVQTRPTRWGRRLNVSVGGGSRFRLHLCVDASHVSIQVCASILAPPGFSFHHSWLMFDQLSHLAVCGTSEGGGELSFQSGLPPSLFACCPMLTPLCRQPIQEIYTYK